MSLVRALRAARPLAALLVPLASACRDASRPEDPAREWRLASVASSVLEQTDPLPPEARAARGAEEPVTPNAFFVSPLDVSGNRIVWAEEGSVVLLDAVTRERRVLARLPGSGLRSPTIEGDLVTWNFGSQQIRVMDLRVGTAIAVPEEQGAYTRYLPRASGYDVLWMADRGCVPLPDCPADLWIWTHEGGRPARVLGSNRAYRASLAMDASAQHAVTLDFVRTPTYDDLYPPREFLVISLHDGSRRRIAPLAAPVGAFDLWEGWIVYLGEREGRAGVWAHELATGREHRITSDAAVEPRSPVVSGGRVTWADRRHGNYDLYEAPVQGGVERRLTDHPLDDGLQASSGGSRLVWLRGPGLYSSQSSRQGQMLEVWEREMH